jgi:hypothetical protein
MWTFPLDYQEGAGAFGSDAFAPWDPQRRAIYGTIQVRK